MKLDTHLCKQYYCHDYSIMHFNSVLYKIVIQLMIVSFFRPNIRACLVVLPLLLLEWSLAAVAIHLEETALDVLWALVLIISVSISHLLQFVLALLNIIKLPSGCLVVKSVEKLGLYICKNMSNRLPKISVPCNKAILKTTKTVWEVLICLRLKHNVSRKNHSSN